METLTPPAAVSTAELAHAAQASPVPEQILKPIDFSRQEAPALLDTNPLPDLRTEDAQRLLNTNQLPDLRSETAQNLLESSSEADRPGRIRRIGHYMANLFKREGFGAGLDMVTMAVGMDVVTREIAGSGVDYAFRKMQGGVGQENEHGHEMPKWQTALYIGGMTVAAVLSQNFMPGAVEHVASAMGAEHVLASLQHGVGEDATELFGKNLATGALNASFKRFTRA
jgi:hypothetical protein